MLRLFIKDVVETESFTTEGIVKMESVHSVHEKALQPKQIRDIKLHESVNHEAPDAMQQEMPESSVEIMSHYGPETPVNSMTIAVSWKMLT